MRGWIGHVATADDAAVAAFVIDERQYADAEAARAAVDEAAEELQRRRRAYEFESARVRLDEPAQPLPPWTEYRRRLLAAPTDQPAGDVRHRYLTGLRALPADPLQLKLADRYCNVQRLHTHPRPAKQRSYYAETCRYLVPLAAADPRLAALFADWERAYQHLGPA